MPAANPDFTQSSITLDPAAPREGDLVALVIVVRNSGGDAAPNTEIDLQLPGAALYVDAAGLDGTSVDFEQRTLSWQGGIDAGGTRTLTVRMIVPRDAGGEVLAPSLRVRQLYTGTESWIHGEGDIQTRLSESGVEASGIRVAPAGLVVLALVAATVLCGLALGARERRRGTHGGLAPARIWGSVVAVGLALGFWALFAAMAHRDWRTLSEFVETECTVLDGRLRSSTAPSATSPVAGRRTTTTTYEPLLALSYRVGNETMISTGFDTGSRLQIGSGARATESFERWRVGSRVPCWYDPQDPRDVLVIPGFGGAYFFALFPLPLVLLALRWRR